jgi:hypothetical protein
MKRSWVLACVLAGCDGSGGPQAGTETGNAALPIDLSISLLTAAPDAAPRGVDARGVPFTLDSVRAFVRRIDFALPDGKTCADLAGAVVGGTCDTDRIRFEGPWVIDLRTGDAVPPMDGLSLPAGLYRRVEVRLEVAESRDVEAGDPLAGNSVEGEGTFGEGRPFALRLAIDEEARFEAPGGVDVSADGARTFVLKLDPASWFADLPVAACAENGELPVVDGKVVVGGDPDDGLCEDLEDVIEDRVKDSGRIDDDDDHHGGDDDHRGDDD